MRLDTIVDESVVVLLCSLSDVGVVSGECVYGSLESNVGSLYDRSSFGTMALSSNGDGSVTHADFCSPEWLLITIGNVIFGIDDVVVTVCVVCCASISVSSFVSPHEIQHFILSIILSR